MKYNVKFSPEQRKDKNGNLITDNVPLFADIRFAGGRMFYFTGYRIDVSKFDSVTQQMKKNTSGMEGRNPVQYNIINNRLTSIESKLIELFKETPDKKTITGQLNDVCNKADKPKPGAVEFYPMFQRYHDEAKLSEGRRKHVTSTMNHWKNFNSNLTFAAIDADTLKAFEKALLNDKKHPRGINTVHSIFNITRSFWNWCRDEYKAKGAILHYPFENYSMPTELYTKPIYITKAERDILFNKKLSNERLAKVRDIFVFQCLVGARVGDLCKFTQQNISNGILSYVPRKTKDDKAVIVTVPLSIKAKEILSRYNLPDGRLLPFITDQRYNTYIKELFKVAELTRSITRLNPTTRKEEQVKLCDIASSHMARRAFIGNMYGKVDSGVISSMSGHIQGSKAFTRYYDVSTELEQQAINLID